MLTKKSIPQIIKTQTLKNNAFNNQLFTKQHFFIFY